MTTTLVWVSKKANPLIKKGKIAMKKKIMPIIRKKKNCSPYLSDYQAKQFNDSIIRCNRLIERNMMTMKEAIFKLTQEALEKFPDEAFSVITNLSEVTIIDFDYCNQFDYYNQEIKPLDEYLESESGDKIKVENASAYLQGVLYGMCLNNDDAIERLQDEGYKLKVA